MFSLKPNDKFIKIFSPANVIQFKKNKLSEDNLYPEE